MERSPEWSQEWTKWGYTRDGVRRGVDRSKHLLHQCGDSPGINQAVFAWWQAHGVPRIRVICTDGAIYTALTRDLADHPRRRAIEYREPQWGWPRPVWDFIAPVDLKQLGLFS